MKLTFIDCSCGNTKGFQLADKLAECTSCASPVHIDTPAYHTYEVESLDKIEQRAKEQAVIDMWLIDMPYIDWATCFDVQSIEEDFTDVVRMVEYGYTVLDEVDKKRFDNYSSNHLPF